MPDPLDDADRARRLAGLSEWEIIQFAGIWNCMLDELSEVSTGALLVQQAIDDILGPVTNSPSKPDWTAAIPQ